MDFSEIYNRYSCDVHRFLFYLSGNPAIAEDLTSETFVHALCGSARLRVDSVKAYLFAIARNLYCDLGRQRRNLVPISDADECKASLPLPDRVAQDRETFSFVLEAIQRLPESQREALVLSLDADMRYEQIAAILGCSIAALKVRIHRARLQLRAELEAQEKLCRM